MRDFLSNCGRRERLEVVVDELLIAGDWVPLEICHAHLLARTVVYAAENVHGVVVKLGAVEESSEGHWG